MSVQTSAQPNPVVLAEDLAAARQAARAGRLEIRDRYRETRAPREVKGIDRSGEEIIGYAYSPDRFIDSDATGRPLRYYVNLANGARVHPDELTNLRAAPGGGWRMPAEAESLRVVDAAGRVASRARSFFNVLGDIAWTARPRDELVTIEAPGGLRRTLTREQAHRLWERWHRRGKPGPEALSFREWAEQHDVGEAPPRVQTSAQTAAPERGHAQMRLFNPLVHGYSRAAISENVSREMHAGRPQDQAVAIALSTARRAYRARHRRGRLPAHLRRNPPPMSSNPGKAARAARREYGLQMQRTHEAYGWATRRARAERPGRWNRGERRRRRNPMSSTDWLDLVVPVAALVILVRGGYLRLSGPPASAPPAAPAPASGPQPTGPGPELASWSH